MRNLILIISCLFLLSACSQESAESSSTNTENARLSPPPEDGTSNDPIIGPEPDEPNDPNDPNDPYKEYVVTVIATSLPDIIRGRDGSDNDLFVMHPKYLGSDDQKRVFDRLGERNLVQIPLGTRITKVAISVDDILFVLENGAQVTFVDCESYSFEPRGNILDNEIGTLYSFDEFILEYLGFNNIPNDKSTVYEMNELIEI